jgi:hypothetical protein
MMVMEVRYNSPLIIEIGNEVAEFVRDHLIDELKKLTSFKQGDYE